MKIILCFFLFAIFSQTILAQVNNFEGITYSGKVPPDPVIAVSDNYVLQAVNSKLAVFNKSGTKLFEQSFNEFFASQSPPASIFDPKVAFDQYNNRFLLLAGARNSSGSESYYMLAVTQSSDPTGNWYKFKLNCKDGGILSQYFIDFPGLGYDEEAIFLTSHQVDGSHSYYPKITILKKSEVYSGAISYRKDFNDFSSGGAYPEKLKPMRKFGSSSGYYLVNTHTPGQIRIWKINNPLLSSASLSVASTITLGNYISISEAVQKGTTHKVDALGHQISDVVCKDGYLYGAYKVKNTTSNGSMIIYFKINTANNFELMINGKIETENKYYYYPVLHPDNEGNIVFVFNKSSSDDYIGVAWTILYSGNSNVEPIKWLKQGSTWYYHLLNNRNRWGDYCGIALDPSNNYRIWICGEWAKTNTEWGTWIGEISTAQTINFTFTNTIYDVNTGVLGDNAGGTLKVNSVTINSGNTMPLETGKFYDEETNNERFPNWNSLAYTYKHNNWNNELNKKFLSDSFFASSTNKNQKAFFKSLNYSRIESRLEEQLIQSKGEFAFQDPWYVFSNGTQPGNHWITATEFYEPTGKEGAQEKGVFLNQDYRVPGQPYYSVKAEAMQDIQLPQTGKTHRFYFQNWSANPPNSAEFKNANALETGVVFKQEGATVSANYKGSMLTNSLSAFSSPSQRKVVRTSNGHLHVVYESMGQIWYEKSVNNGMTWSPPQNLTSYYDGIKSSHPSIEYSGDKVFVTFQGYDELSSSSAILVFQIDENGNITEITLPIEVSSFSVEAKPVIGANSDNIIIIWKDEKLKLKRLFYNQNQWHASSEVDIPYTGVNSINPAISMVKATRYSLMAPMRTSAHIVWEERESTVSSSLNYIKGEFLYDNTNNIIFSNYKNITTGSGFEVCTNPSVIGIDEKIAHIGFLGQRKFYPVSITMVPDESRAVFTSLALGNRFFAYGEDVKNVSLNKTDSNNRWVFAWTRDNNLPVQYVDSRDLRKVYEIGNLTGVDLQISNGVNPEALQAFVLNTSAAPYWIRNRAIYPVQIPPTYEEPIYTEQSREGKVSKEEASTYYSFGDIKVGDTRVEMKEIPEEVELNSLDAINGYLNSKPFMVNDHSNFKYSIRYGVIDTVSLKAALTNTDYIRFRVELIDYTTKAVVGVFDEVEYNKENVSNYDKVDYEVNTYGLGERMVQLRLVINNNIDPYYTLTDIYIDEAYNMQKKQSYKLVSYRGMLGEKVFTYLLQQNYPNPFNPTTRIRYSLKDTKPVEIKLYDLVGREVATVLNEVKDAGEYEVEIDASRYGLSSGVYFYQMRAGEFKSIKKMVVLK